MNDFSHIDENGNAIMVDVSDKDITKRTATAKGRIYMDPATLQKIQDGQMKKGDVLNVAQLAGIMGAKKTPDLIPLCHPLSLSSVTVTLQCNEQDHCIDLEATCQLKGRTGVEMEALTAVSITALTVYDMCKGVDKAMVISDVRLTFKDGGKSGTYEAP